MPKHKAKKKNLKKRVQKKAQKIKELTAQDLLLHPELLQSPQFKALPLEKQFQLTSQLKQLRMMMNKPMNGLGAVSSSNADSLYSKFLDSNSKLQQAQNETQKLKQQIEETERQRELEAKKQNELKEAQHRYNKTMKHNNAINDLQRQMDNLNEQFNTDQINDLKTRASQILDSREQQKAQKRRDEWQKQNDEFMNQLAQIPDINYDKALELYELSSIENQRRNNRLVSKLIKNQQELNDLNDRRSILQEVTSTFNDNGEEEKAEQTEYQISDINDEITQKKTTSITETNNDNNEFIPEEIQDETEEDINQNQESSTITNDEPLEQQNTHLEAQKMILQDKIKDIEEDLKSKQQLQQEEERANLLNQYNEQRLRIQQRYQRSQLIKRFNEKHDNILNDIVAAENLQDSTTLKPFVLNKQKQLKELAKQYPGKSHEEKMKIMTEMNDLNDDIEQQLNHWKSQQATLAKQAQYLEDLQIKNGIHPNLNYRISLTKESKKSSPTKNTAILTKIENETKQVEQGINELNEIKTLRKSAYALANQLQEKIIKNRVKNPSNVSFVWKQIIYKAGDSKPKLQYIINDLNEETKKAELKQDVTQIKPGDYLKKIEPLNEDKINVAQPNEETLFYGDDSWINDIKPNDKFDFELKDIAINPKATKGQVFKSVLGEILKEGAKWTWEHKWTRYMIIGAGVVLAVRFMPEKTGNFVGKIAGKLSLGLAKMFGNQLHQITDISQSYYEAVKPGINGATEAIKPHIKNGLNYASEQLQNTYNQFSATEAGQLTIDTVNNVKNLLVDGIDLAATTTKTALRVTKSTLPIAGKGLGIIDFTLDKSGKAISCALDGVNSGLDWVKLGATNLGKSIYSVFKGKK